MKDKIRIAIFLLLIFGLTAGSLLKKPVVFSQNENRYLAEKPKFSKEALFDGSYTADYETFITDQFIWRDQWISVKTKAERLTLRQDINGVFFGKDGYLMEKHGSDTFASEQSGKNAGYLAKFVENFQDKFDPEHMQVLLVPTASQVLKEKLPLFAPAYDQSVYVDSIRTQIPEEYVLYGGDALADHADEYIYYKTDHHWTTLGAYYAYQEWCERMGISPYTMDDFDVEEATKEFFGTLDSKVNTKVTPDSMFLYHLKEQDGWKPEYSLTYDRTDDVRDVLYDYKALKGKDKYSVYLGGNYGEVDIRTNVKNGKTLMVVKDSFAHSFVPFAVNHYERVLMVDLRYFNMPLTAYAEEEGVTDVLVLYNLANVATDKNLMKITR